MDTATTSTSSRPGKWGEKEILNLFVVKPFVIKPELFNFFQHADLGPVDPRNPDAGLLRDHISFIGTASRPSTYIANQQLILSLFTIYSSVNNLTSLWKTNLNKSEWSFPWMGADQTMKTYLTNTLSLIRAESLTPENIKQRPFNPDKFEIADFHKMIDFNRYYSTDWLPKSIYDITKDFIGLTVIDLVNIMKILKEKNNASDKSWNYLMNQVYGTDILGESNAPSSVKMFFRLKSETELVDEIIMTHIKIEQMRTIKSPPINILGDFGWQQFKQNPDTSTRPINLVLAAERQITNFNDFMPYASRLAIINFFHTRLNTLLGAEKFSNIMVINVSRTEIKDSDLKYLSGLKKLKWLELNGNDISNLTPLSGLDLVGLGVACTKISTLAPITGMKNLTFLDLYQNPLFKDIASLLSLKSLTDLDIRRTPINVELVRRNLPSIKVLSYS